MVFTANQWCGSVGATGQFNFAVEEGYLIKNGKLTNPVKDTVDWKRLKKNAKNNKVK